jgi:hypothetical protein
MAWQRLLVGSPRDRSGKQLNRATFKSRARPVQL